MHPEQLFQHIPPLSKDIKSIIFIDEIQYLKDPSNFLKYHYDKYNTILKFIVSGSSSFYIDRKFTDSLAGRKRIFKLPTLSFEEFIFFNDREDILPHLNAGKLPGIYSNDLNKLLHEYLIFGSYPEVVLEPAIQEKKAILKELSDSYIKKDIIESKLQSQDVYYQILQS